MPHPMSLIAAAARDFAFGHFIGIAQALTIHREHASVTVRDVFGALARLLLLSGLFIDLPAAVLYAACAVLAISFMLRVVYVIACLSLPGSRGT